MRSAKLQILDSLTFDGIYNNIYDYGNDFITFTTNPTQEAKPLLYILIDMKTCKT